MRAWFAAFLLSVPVLAGAQDMYKCVDAKGKITYMSQTCESMRLKSAGEVKGQISVTPALPVPQAPSGGVAAPLPVSPPAQPAPAAQAAPPKLPVDGDSGNDKRCFKTANGTRCNDDPGK